MCSSVARASEKESPSFSYGENVKFSKLMAEFIPSLPFYSFYLLDSTLLIQPSPYATSSLLYCSSTYSSVYGPTPISADSRVV